MTTSSAPEQSRFLIVICSSQAPESQWGCQEIKTFRELGGGDQILALLIDGEPQTSFPKPLTESQTTVIEHGVPKIVVESHEPLAVDIRGENIKEILQRLKQEKLRLLAPLLGCGYDDLRQRHRRRKEKFWYWCGGMIFFGVPLLIAVLVLTLQ